MKKNLGDRKDSFLCYPVHCPYEISGSHKGTYIGKSRHHRPPGRKNLILGEKEGGVPDYTGWVPPIDRWMVTTVGAVQHRTCHQRSPPQGIYRNGRYLGTAAISISDTPLGHTTSITFPFATSPSLQSQSSMIDM